MNFLHKIGIFSLLGIAFGGITSAATSVPFISTDSVKPAEATTVNGVSADSSSSPRAESTKMIAPYYGDSARTYIFDQTGSKAMIAQTSNLLKVNCNTAQVLSALGLGNNSKITSISIGEESFDFSFDFRSCSLWGNKRNSTRTNTPLTEETALAKAKAFIKTTYLAKKIYSSYGAPIVLYRNGNNIRPYVMKGAESSVQPTEDLSTSGIEIDPTDTGDIDVKPEYTSFSILFPYTINGTPVYNAYGQRAGIQLEVNAEGVVSMNAQLLPFKGAVRNAEKLSGDDLVNFVKKGGNNPFRGSDPEVKLYKPNRVFVLFSLWRNNTTEMYLSSGIRFGSNQKTDKYQAQNYEMIISDYKIGNSNFGW